MIHSQSIKPQGQLPFLKQDPSIKAPQNQHLVSGRAIDQLIDKSFVQTSELKNENQELKKTN